MQRLARLAGRVGEARRTRVSFEWRAPRHAPGHGNDARAGDGRDRAHRLEAGPRPPASARHPERHASDPMGRTDAASAVASRATRRRSRPRSRQAMTAPVTCGLIGFPSERVRETRFGWRILIECPRCLDAGESNDPPAYRQSDGIREPQAPIGGMGRERRSRALPAAHRCPGPEDLQPWLRGRFGSEPEDAAVASASCRRSILSRLERACIRQPRTSSRCLCETDRPPRERHAMVGGARSRRRPFMPVRISRS